MFPTTLQPNRQLDFSWFNILYGFLRCFMFKLFPCGNLDHLFIWKERSKQCTNMNQNRFCLKLFPYIYRARWTFIFVSFFPILSLKTYPLNKSHRNGFWGQHVKILYQEFHNDLKARAIKSRLFNSNFLVVQIIFIF